LSPLSLVHINIFQRKLDHFDQDSRGVPMPRAVLLGGLDEPLDPDGCSSPSPPDIAGLGGEVVKAD
jgi:hypothetical protein